MTQTAELTSAAEESTAAATAEAIGASRTAKISSEASNIRDVSSSRVIK
jgi:hypothetical protein